MPPRGSVSVAVAVLLVTSGCAGLSFDDGGAQSPPSDDVAAKFGSLETVSGTQVFSFRSDNGTNHTRATVHVDLGDPVRIYQRAHAPAERAGDVFVANGSTSVAYDASENSVTYRPRVGGAWSLDRGEFFARVAAAAREDETVEDPGGVSPLPVVPTTTTESGRLDAIEAYEVTYLGTDTVDGRTVHGFRMTAVSDAAIDFDRTMWLDAEYYYPLRMNQTVTFENETYHAEMRLQNATFNGDLPEGVFEFERPAGATVESPDFETRSFGSLSALRADASVRVPDPAVPDGYELRRALLVRGDRTRLGLQYESEDGRLTVSKSVAGSGGERNEIPGGESVSVGGYDGRYLATGQSNLVTWSCGGYEYTVVGAPLGKEALLDVAESVVCE